MSYKFNVFTGTFDIVNDDIDPSLPLSLANGGWGISNTRTSIGGSGTLNNQAVASVWLDFTGTIGAISGFVAQPDGTEIIVTNNKSSGTSFTLQNQNSGSSATNRIINPNQIDIDIPYKGSVTLRYDGSQSRWVWVSSGFGIANIIRTGYISSADWNTFNGKIGGSGADGTIPFFHPAGSTLSTDPTNLFWDITDARLGLGTNTPLYRFDAIAASIIVGNPTAFSATLVPESLGNPPADAIALIYGPQDNGSGSGTENPGYSGYVNNDTVMATVFSYTNVGGTNYVSPAGINLGTVTLVNNPSGIDWSWSAETNGDGSAVTGYVIEIVDQTTSTTNFFDVGNVLAYADMNASGSPSNPYSPFGGFTSSGQTFAYDIFLVGTSPTGGTFYNDNGNGFNITVTEGFNNGSDFWVRHIISPSGAWRELEQINSSLTGGFDGSGGQTFYETSQYSGTTTSTPNHYGIQSNGMTLNRDYEFFTYDPTNAIYSSGDLTASVTDPNDSNYYSITYTYSTPTGDGKILEQINSGGFNFGNQETVSPFYQDVLGGAIGGSNTVTPTSSPTTAGIFENNADALSQVAQLILNSNASSNDYEALVLKGNGSVRAILSYDRSNTALKLAVASSSDRIELSYGTTANEIFTIGGVTFNANALSSYSIVVDTSSIAAFFYLDGANTQIRLGGLTTTNSTAWFNIAGATTSKAQLNLPSSGGTPSSPRAGDIWVDANWHILFESFVSPSNYTAQIIQTGTSASLTNGTYPKANAHGDLVDGTIVTGEVVSGSGTSFTLANTPATGSLALYGNGLRLKSGVDYSVSGTSITILLGTYSAGTLLADYR